MSRTSERSSPRAARVVRHKGTLRQEFVRRTAALLGSASIAATQVLPAYAQVVGVGGSGTNVNTAGLITDVTTTNIQGSTAFNQFSQFDVATGNTVNLFQPLGANKLVNIITGGSSTISGMVNGHLGVPGVIQANLANLYFVNSDGFVVSATGSINAQQITMTTPTADFVADLIGEANGSGPLTYTPTQRLFLGTEPLNPNGEIDIQGALYAQRLDLRAGARMIVDGRLSVDADLTTGRINPAVNLQGVPTAGGINIDKNGVIRLVSGGSMSVRGQVSAKGASGGFIPHGGLVEGIAEGDMTVGGSFDVSNGAGDAGSVMLYTKGSATMEPAFSLTASSTAGAGGFFALRAVGDITGANGTLNTGSATGDPGEAFLVGENVAIGGNITTNGGSLGVSAAKSVTVSNGVSVTTAPAAAGPVAGDLIIAAPTITIESGAVLSASEAGADKGGLLALIARNRNTGIVWAINPESEVAEITITGATLEAGSVIVSASASASNIFGDPTDETLEATQVAEMEDSLTDGEFDGLLTSLGNDALLALEGGLSTLNGLAPLQVQVLSADASVTITESFITANGNWAGRSSSAQNEELEFAENGYLSPNGLREDTYRFMTANSWFDALLGDDNPYQMKLYLPSVWDDETDSLLIHSHAETVSSISPFAYGAGLAIAVTDTKSQVSISDSDLWTDAGNIRMASTAMENMSINIAAKKLSNSAGALAIGVRSLTNQIVADGSNITSAGRLDMGAFTGRNISQTLVANSGMEGRVSIAVNVDVATSLTEAALGGTVNAGDDVAVDAETLFFNSTHVTTATMGLTNVDKLVAASRRQNTNSLQGLATQVHGGASRPDPDRKPHFGFGVALDVQVSDDNTFATIGGSYRDFDDLAAPPIALGETFVTAAGQNVAVNAAYRFADRGTEGGSGLTRSTSAAFGKLTRALQRTIDRHNARYPLDPITEDDVLGRYSNALMMNVSVASMTGETRAEIGSAATISAGSLDVDALTRYPNTNPVGSLVGQWQVYADAVTEYQPVSETGVAEPPEPAAPPAPDLAGFLDIVNPLTYLTTDSKAKGDAPVADNRVVVPDEEQQLAIGLSVTFFGTDNTTNSVISSGATVNLDSAANVTATQESLFLHVVNLPRKSPLSGSAKVNDAIGVGIFAQRTVSDVRAEIESGASVTVNTGDLDVTATTKNIVASLAYSGGQGSDVAVNATINAQISQATTVASIGEAATVTASNVRLTAKDESVAWVSAGAISGSDNVGVGASGVFNLTTRDIWAGIGTKDAITSVADLAAATGTVIDAGTLTILAENNATDITVAVAGTKVVGKPDPEPDPAPSTPPPTNNDEDDMIIPSWLFAEDEEDAVNPQSQTTTPADQQGQQQQSGWAISGAAVVNLSLGNKTRAEILTQNEIDLDGALSLTAKNTALAVNVGGAVSAGLGSDQDTNALAGAFAVHVDTRRVEARVLGAEINTGTVTVKAEDLATVVNIAVGGAGTSRGDLALAGSVAVAVLDGGTEAEIEDARITSETLALDADDTSTTVSVGGAVGINMDATQGYGVGVGVAVNSVTRSATARLAGSGFAHVGALSLTADSTQSIYSFATSAGVGKTGLSGSIAVNNITGGAEALVEGSEAAPYELEADSATVDATETNTIFSLGGALAGGRSGAVGAALTVNVITATTRAMMTDTVLSKRDAGPDLGAVSVTSDSTSTITSIAVAGAASQSDTALAVGISANEITATTETSLARTSITDAASVTAKADSTRVISSLGGGLGISGRGAAGAAATLNLLLGNTTKVILDSADITTRDGGAIEAKATANGTIRSMAAGISASNDATISGGITVNVTTAETLVSANAAILEADGLLTLKADDTGTVQSLAGGAAISVKSSAVGGAVAANFIAHDTKVLASGSELSGEGVTLQAVNGSTIASMAVGLAGGATDAFSGSIAIGDIGNTTTAQATDTTIDAGGGLATIDAGRTGSIDILSGSAAVGGSNAAGIALTVATIHGGVSADLITQNPITAAGLAVSARNTADIDALAVSGAVGTGGAGGSGSVVYTQIGRVGVDGPSVDPISGDTPGEDPVGEMQAQVAAERDAAVAALATSLGSKTNTSLASGDLALELTTDDLVRARVELTGEMPTIPGVSVTTTEETTTRSLAGAVGVGVSSAGIGAGLAVNLMFGKAEAELVLPAGETITVDGAVDVSVTQTGTVETAGVAGGGGGSVGGAGSITVNVMNRQADARIVSNIPGTRATLATGGGAVNLGVTQTGTIKSLAGSVGIGGNAGFGGAIVVNVISDDADALLRDTELRTADASDPASDPLQNAGAVTITAQQTTGLEALAAAIAGSGGGAFAGSFAVNVADGAVFATLQRSRVESQALTLSATATPTLIGNAGAISASGGAVGVGIVTNVARQHVRADVDGSQIFARDAVQVRAAAHSDMSGNAISGSGGGVAVTGSAVANSALNTVETFVRQTGALVTPGPSGSLPGSTIITRGSVLVSSLGTNTISLLGGTEEDPVSTTPGTPGISVNFAGGGTAGVGASVTVNTLGNDVRTAILGNTGIVGLGHSGVDDNGTTKFGVVINAFGNSDMAMVTANGAVGGIAGVAALFGMNLIDDKARVEIGSIGAGELVQINTAALLDADVETLIGTRTATLGQDTEITARTENSAIVVTANIAVGGSAGVGASSSNTLVTNLAEVWVKEAEIDAADRLDIAADAITDLDTVTLGLAGGLAGATMNAAVNRIGSRALVRVDGAGLSAGNAIDVSSKVDSDSWGVTGSVGGGAFGGAGGVQVTLFDSTSQVTLGEGASTRLSSLDADSINVRADSDLTTDGNAISGAVGGTALALAANVTVVEAATVVDVGAATTMTSTGDLQLAANDTVTIKSLTGSLGAGGVGVGASIDYAGFSGVTKVEIGEGATLEANYGTNPLASPDSSPYGMSISAQSTRDVDSNVKGVGVAGLAVVGALSVIDLGAKAEDEDNKRNDLLAQVQTELDADQSGETGNATDDKNAASGLMAYAGATGTGTSIGDKRQAIDLTDTPGEDTVMVDIGTNVTLSSRSRVIIEANSVVAVKQDAGGAALSLTASAISGTAVTNVGSGAKVSVGAGSVIQADGRIMLLANNAAFSGRDMVDARAATVAASAGYGVGVGVAYAKVTATSEVTLGNGVRLEGFLRNRSARVDLTASRSGRVVTDTFNVAGGLAGGVGVAVSHAINEGASIVQLGDDSGTDLVTILAGDVTLATNDTSRVVATGEGSSGGIAAGVNSVVITADVEGTNAIIARNLEIEATSISLDNLSAASGYAEARGLAIGAVSIGASVARANLRATLDTDIVAVMDATTIALNTRIYRDTEDHAKAVAASTSGGLLAGNGAEANAYVNYTVNAAYAGLFLADQSVTIDTDASEAQARAEASGVSGGVAALGLTIARAGQNMASDLTEAEKLASVATAINSAAFFADSVTVTTGNAPGAHAQATSGAGGIVAGSGAESWVKTNTAATTDFGTTGFVMVNAESVDIATSQTVTLGGKVNTISASAVGYSGGRADTEVTSNVATRFGGQAEIWADNVAISASNTVSRPEDGFNITSGSGGALDVAAMVSDITVNAGTDVFIDDGAQITQTGLAGAGQVFAIGTFTNMAIIDRLQLDSGGAIAVPVGTGIIDVQTNRGTVTVGDAVIRAVDTVTFYSGGDANIKSEVNSNSYGLSGAATGNTTATFNADNRVVFLDGAEVESLEDVRVQSGFGAREAQEVKVRAETRVFNRTAIPIPTDPAADATANTVSIIDVQEGSSIKAVRDVYLLSEAGSRDVVGYGRGKDYYREVAAELGSAVSEAFGGDPVSLDIESGSSTDLTNDGILVNGYVRAGSRNRQIAIFDLNNQINNLYDHAGNGPVTDANGNPYTDEMAEGITFSVREDVPLNEEFQKRVDLLNQLISDPILSTDAAAVLAWEAERDQLLARMATMTGNADFIDLDDIVASEGNIILRADYVHGTPTGTLDAPGNAEVKVHVYSDAYLNTANITIPANAGGRITFNDVTVTTPADINALSVPWRVPLGPTNYNMISGDQAGEPLIEVVTYGGGSLIVDGDISNADGTARFYANGPTADLDVRGDIFAQTIDLSAGRDFVQGYKVGFTEIEGDPRAIYESFFDKVEGQFMKTVLNGTTVNGVSGGDVEVDTFLGTLTIGTIPEFKLAPRRGQIRAGRNVYISADKLNINGKIQAGTGSYDISIDAAIDTYLDDLLSKGLSGSKLLHDPAEPVNENVVRNANIDSNVKIWFEENGVDEAGNVTGKIVVSPMVVQGGRVELIGEVFSTGGGEIQSLDGFGVVNVDSGSKYAVELARIDLGELGALAQGVEGVVRITDTSREIRPGEFLITEFRRVGAEFRELDNETFTTEEFDFDNDSVIDLVRVIPTHLVASSTAKDGRSGTYQPTPNIDLVINRAETVTRVTEHYKKTFYFWWKGGTEISSEVKETKATPLPPDVAPGLNGTYLAPSLAGSDYAYHFRGRRVSSSTTEKDRVVDDQRVLGIGDVIETWKTTQVSRHLYTHRLKADYGVKITFDGADTGGLTIVNGGDVIFTDLVNNRVGDSSVTSQEGSVLTSDTSVRLNVGNLDVQALGGRIGGFSSEFRIDQSAGTALTAIARDSIDIREMNGDMVIAEVRTTDRSANVGSGINGQVRLMADGSILARDAATQVTGSSIDLVSIDGGIGTDTQSLTILEDGARLTARARGDVFIEESAGDLNLNTVESQTGSVELVAMDGAILDRNDIEQRDVRTESELADLWTNDLALNGSEAAARQEAQITALKIERKRAYEAYWRAREADGGAAQTFALDAATEQALLNGGWSQAELDAYKATYSDLYATWNGEAAYLPDFEYLVSFDERAEYLEGSTWTTQELNEWIRAGLIRGTGDTNVRIEDPNVIAAGDITLTARDAVGELLPDFVLGSDRAANLAALATAERADVIIDNTANTVTVRQAEDVNFAFTQVNLEGQSLGNLRVTSAGQDIFLAAETPATLANLNTTANVRIKIDGAMTDNRDGAAAVTGSAIVVESGNDAPIGEDGNPLTFDVLAGGNLIARSGQEMFIHAIGNLPIAEIFAGGAARITAAGAITDDVATGAVRVRAADITLDGASVGTDAAPLVLDITDATNGMLDLTAQSGDAYVTVASGLQLEKADIFGGGRVTATSSFALMGADTISFGTGATLALIAPEGIALDASSGTDIAGGTLVVTSGGSVGTAAKRLQTALGTLSFATTGSEANPLFVNELDDLHISSVVQTHPDADTNVIAGGVISVGTISNQGETVLVGEAITEGRIVSERVALTANGTAPGSGIGETNRLDITTARFLAETAEGDIIVLLRDRATEIEAMTAGGFGVVDLISTDAPLTLLAGAGITTQGGTITIDATSLVANANILSRGGDVDIDTAGDFLQAAGTRVDAGAGLLDVNVAGDMQVAQIATTNATRDALRLNVDGTLSVADGQTETQIIANAPGALTVMTLGALSPVGPDGLVTRIAELDIEVGAGPMHINEEDGIILTSVENRGGMIDIFAGGRTEIGTLTAGAGAPIVVSSSAGDMVSDGAAITGGDVRLFAFGGALAGLTGDTFRGDTTDGVTLHLLALDDLNYLETAGDLRVGFALSDQGDLSLEAPNGRMELGVLGAAGDFRITARDELRLNVVGGASVDLADEVALELVNPEFYGLRTAQSPENIELTATGDASQLYGGLISAKGTVVLRADFVDVHLYDKRPSDPLLLTITDDEGGMTQTVDVQSIGDGPDLFIEDYFADVRPRLAGRDRAQGQLILEMGRIGTGQVTHAGPSFIGQDVVIGGDVWFRQRSFDLLANLDYLQLSTVADTQALAHDGGRIQFDISDEIRLVTIAPGLPLDGSGGTVLVLNRRLGGVDLNGGQGFAFGVGVEADILGYPFTFSASAPGVTRIENLRQIREQGGSVLILPMFVTEDGEEADACVVDYSQELCLQLSMLR